MTISVKSILTTLGQQLEDQSFTTWTMRELVGYINGALREMYIFRPDIFIRTANVLLEAGPVQSLDLLPLADAPAKLVEITSNTAAASNGSIVRLAPRAVIDAQVPGWKRQTPTLNIVHYMPDLRDAKTFYVYPPAAVGAEVEMTYMAVPPLVDLPLPTATLDSLALFIGLDAQYENPLTFFALAMAQDRDSEEAANPGRSQARRAAFQASLAGDLQSSLQTKSRPKSRSERADA